MEQIAVPPPLVELIGPLPPSSGAPERRAEVSETLPSPAGIGRAVLGFALLGCVAALGAAAPDSAARVLPAAIVVDLGALVLTGPALVVGHQVMGLDAAVPELVGCLAHAFCRAGTIALGLCPALLFFAATSGLAPALFALALLAIAVFGLLDGFTGLTGAERRAGPEETRMVRLAKMHTLVAGWVGLTALVGLRLGLHLMGV